MSRDLLLEIGTEEIPSAYLPALLDQLRERLSAALGQSRIACSSVRPLGTPRRLALWARDVAERQEDLSTKVFGPPRRVALDAQGAPTKAGIGFARGQGVPVDALQVETTPKGEYVFAVKEEKGRPSREVLVSLLPQFISALSFPKSMHWGRGTFRFVRPIHWIAALWGPEPLPFELEGIRSSNQSCGHRFLSPGPLTIPRPEDYVDLLREHRVVADPEERRRLVACQVLEAAAREGGTPLEDEALLSTVTFLVEVPTAITGHFPAHYLVLPEEVLVTAMVKHQRYFPVLNSSRRLLPCFVAVANTAQPDPGVENTIRAGNERVLQARLSDANFFFQEDTRKPLAGYLPGLAKVVFQEKLGTLQEKVGRIEALVENWAAGREENVQRTARRAAALCKADLLTQMVYEFPELQGVMGREYARKSGEPEEVALAVYEHYLPRFPGDQIPGSVAGALVGLADRMDTLAGYFGVGLIPSGSEDPFALRRQAQGVIAVLQGSGLRLALPRMLDDALARLRDKITSPAPAVREEVSSFLRQRLFGHYTVQGYAADVVNGALAAGWSDVVSLTRRIEALSRFKGDPEFGSLFLTCKRLLNITRSSALPEGERPQEPPPVREDLLTQGEERDLYTLAGELGESLREMMRTEDFDAALAGLRSLWGPVDRFFSSVMVMVEDPEIRQNRLNLLRRVADLFTSIADFSQLTAPDSGGKAGA